MHPTSPDPKQPQGDLRTTNRQDSIDAAVMVGPSISRIKKLFFSAPSKCRIDLFGPVANERILERLHATSYSKSSMSRLASTAAHHAIVRPNGWIYRKKRVSEDGQAAQKHPCVGVRGSPTDRNAQQVRSGGGRRASAGPAPPAPSPGRRGAPAGLGARQIRGQSS